MACGAPRPANVHFYLSANAPVVADAAAIARAKAGVDWRCSSCEASNKAWDTHCSACGNPREGTDTGYQAGDAARVDGGYRASIDGSGPTSDEDSDIEVTWRPRGQGRALRWAMLAAAFLMATFCSGLAGVFFFYESYDAYADAPVVEQALQRRAALLAEDRCSKRIARVPVEVTEHRWQRKSHWDQYIWVSDSGWSTPGGARNVSSRRKIHHYDKVFDGYDQETYYETETVGSESYVCGQRSLGNGYFEDKMCTRSKTERVRKTRQVERYRDEPVYQTWYDYEVQRWITQGSLASEGVGTERHWPTPPKSGSDVRRVDDAEALQAVIVEQQTDEPRNWTLPLQEGPWLALTDGDLRDFGVDGCDQTYGLLKEVE